MNSKPKSSLALMKAASHCTHPELDGVDKSLLAYLAMYADKITGENSHPGNKNIADALGLTDRPTDARLQKNVARGLIERTARADGRSKASTYRLCIESPYYPNRTPGGEWLIEEPPNPEPPGDKPRCVGSADNSELADKPRCVGSADNSETALPTGENRAAETPKPRCDSPETALSGQPAIKSHPNPTNHPPKPEPWDGWLVSLPTELHGSILSKGNQSKLESQIQQHGRELVKAAIVRWVLVREMDIAGLRSSKWDAWFRECGPHVQYALSEQATNAQRLKDAVNIEANINRQLAEESAATQLRMAAHAARKAREGAPAEAYFAAMDNLVRETAEHNDLVEAQKHADAIRNPKAAKTEPGGPEDYLPK